MDDCKRFLIMTGELNLLEPGRPEPAGKCIYSEPDGSRYWVDEKAPLTAPSLETVVRRIDAELPNWWWSCGYCKRSAHASIGPEECTDAMRAKDERFNEGFHADLGHPIWRNFTPADALLLALNDGLDALSRSEGADRG